MKEIKRDNAVINYEVTGKGDTTLLFVHGAYTDLTYWKDQVDYFKQEYTVVTLDLAGHGQSGKNRKKWSVAGFAKDVITIIKNLGLKNVILIGHSLGAAINLMAATTYPEPLIGFIAIDTFKNAAMLLPAAMQQQVKTILQNLKTDFANTNEHYVTTALLTKETPLKIRIRVIKDFRNAWPPMGIETMPEVFKMFTVEKKLLPLLNFKLYLINVDYLPTDETPLQQYPPKGYEAIYMQGTCHYPMLENPDELNKLLEEVIQKIKKTAT